MTHERRISDAEHEWRSCTRKIQYLSAEGARAVCAAIYDATRSAMQAYPCEFCAGWHVGHPLDGRAQRRVVRRLEKARRKTLWKESA